MKSKPVILVAEDEENDFILLERAFNRLEQPTSLVRVSDGVEVVDYLEGVNGFHDRSRFPFPDVLVLDLKMPCKNGCEVLSWIRRHPRFKHMIVVVFSSSDQPGDIGRAYALGANSYLTKPAAYADLVELTHVLTTYWLRWSRRPEVDTVQANEPVQANEAAPAPV